jgi:hypothetical protein
MFVCFCAFTNSMLMMRAVEISMNSPFLQTCDSMKVADSLHNTAQQITLFIACEIADHDLKKGVCSLN